MKYLKKYKIYEAQESSYSNLFDELFTDVKDEGFNVKTQESSSIKIDFSESPVVHSSAIRSSSGDELLDIHSHLIRTIDVKIDKKTKDPLGQYALKRFLVDDIKENLLFVESYAKHELGLDIAHIYVSKVPVYIYYKSIDYLPFDSNWWIDSVTFSFTKRI